MSAVMSKELRVEVLALADQKRDGTVASVKQMLVRHAQKAAKRRRTAQVSKTKIDDKIKEQLAF